MASTGSASIVRHVGEADATRWDAFVEAAPEATFFHRFAWKAVIEQSFGHRCYYLCSERSGQITGILPLTLLRSRLFGNSLVSCGFGVEGGPVVTGSVDRRELTAAAVALADRLDVDFLEYRGPSDPSADVGDSWIERSDLYVSFKKSIAADAEANLKAVPRKQRAMIRKGIKLGLESEIDADTDRLYDIYSESVRNLGTPVFPKKYFRALKSAFGRDCEILTVTNEGKPLSSVMSFYFRGTVMPYYGGGRSEARLFAANDFMYWEVMRRAAELGINVFDFGRSKTAAGSFHFKKNWGFVPTPITYSYYLKGATKVPEINPNNPKYELAIALWKRLPLPLTRIIGPLIARGLG